MLENILRPEIQQFIRDHENEDAKVLVLKQSEILGVPAALIAEQISGRKKAKDKLPTWYQTKKIVYPPTLNLEQCSSEQTAAFKAKILCGSNSHKIADLTGGFGVDTFYFSKCCNEVHYVEPNNGLFEIALNNFKQLGGKVTGHNQTAEGFVHKGAREGGSLRLSDSAVKFFDAFYIDPSRRKSTQRVFKLADCAPDITSLQDLLFSIAPKILIKTSPLLDIRQGLSELRNVKKVFVVAVKNEVKELLFLCEKGFDEEPIIEAVNLFENKPNETFSFLSSEEKNLDISFGGPQQYLYEPNAAILKAGAFKTISKKFSLTKIHPNTHLYTSESLMKDFPGRIFEIEAFVKPVKKELLNYFPDGKANITTRNYPLSPEQLKKKTGLRDGGEKFLIGFSREGKKFLVVGVRL